MSDDYPIAIECGSTMVRIGSKIFGERESRRKLRAVFFDQDGVLYNSMPYHAASWAWAMTKHGLPYTPEECYKNEGRTSTGVIREHHMQVFGTDATPELIEAIYADKSARFTEMTGGFPGTIPGVSEVLRYLHEQGIECWVVTGSGQRNLINALNETFDNVFTGIISSFDVKKGKPDPEPYLKAWERSGFKKEECMVVENAPLGVRAAKAAGLFTVAVNTGPLPDELLWNEKADVVLPNMQALLEMLKKKAMNEFLEKEEEILKMLKTVFDPEIPVNIYDLGLIYGIELKDDGVCDITMTLTAPSCPAGDFIVEDIRQKVGSVEGVKDVNVTIVFEPEWTKDMMSEEAKLELGFL
jgi:FeS assembly SUF system protein